MTASGFLRDILIDNRQNAIWNMKRILHIADPHRSWAWKESEEHYSSINVKGKRVLMLGSDYGITPMYLIERGAESVVGFSLWKQYFFDPRYTHITDRFTMDKIKGMDFDVMFSDCEGCEYLLTKDYLATLKGYVICFHNPIENHELFDYVKSKSIYMTPPSKVEGYREEIAIFTKVRT